MTTSSMTSMFSGLSISARSILSKSSRTTQPSFITSSSTRLTFSKPSSPRICISLQYNRNFSTTSSNQSWLQPQNVNQRYGRRGQVHVATGGSTRGTTVCWGDYGLRMKDAHRRLSALQLKNGEDTIKKRLRGMKYRLYTRVACSTPVFKKGNEVRMGGGKGSFNHWAARIRVSSIVFELKGEIHEKIARDAFRLAAAKMPGTYEFALKSDPPVMGITKLHPEVIQELLDSKHKLPFKLQKMREAQREANAQPTGPDGQPHTYEIPKLVASSMTQLP